MKWNKLTREEIRDELAKVVTEQLSCNLEDVVETASFVDDLGADALDTIELVMAVEDLTDETIDDDDIPKLKTFGDLVNHVAAKLK